MRRRYLVFPIVMILLVLSLIPIYEQPKTQITKTVRFVLSVEPWTFPDENGQGVNSYWLYYYPSGYIFDKIGYPDYPYTEWTDLDNNTWEYNTSLEIAVFTYLNGTFLGFSSLAEGKNYLRHSINVILLGDTIISQQNLTYVTGTDSEAPIYIYKHNIILSCFNTVGGIYTVVMDCEIYY